MLDKEKCACHRIRSREIKTMRLVIRAKVLKNAIRNFLELETPKALLSDK